MSFGTIASIEAQIKQHEQYLADAKLALEKAKRESPDKQLAKDLHDMLCKWNHTDGCGWYYEMSNGDDDWTGHDHGRYLTKAQTLLHCCNERGISVEEAIDIYKLVQGV